MIIKGCAILSVSLTIFMGLTAVAAEPEPLPVAAVIPTVTVTAPEKSQVCAACHGVDGNSTVGLWPKLAGQHQQYIIKELISFRNGDKGGRKDPSMMAMAKNLSDQDIQELAAYYAVQMPIPGSTKPELLKLGESIYRGGNLKTGVSACIACHGPSGDGNALGNFPKLSGQHADYTATQLKQFREGSRTSDPNSIMRDIAKRMSDEEIQAVSDYVSGLH